MRSCPGLVSPPTGSFTTSSLTSKNLVNLSWIGLPRQKDTHPAPSSQDLRLAATTPSSGLIVAFRCSIARPIHPGTAVPSSASCGSLNLSAILSVQSVWGLLLCSLESERTPASTSRGLGSISRNSTMPSGLSKLSNANETIPRNLRYIGTHERMLSRNVL